MRHLGHTQIAEEGPRAKRPSSDAMWGPTRLPSVPIIPHERQEDNGIHGPRLLHPGPSTPERWPNTAPVKGQDPLGQPWHGNQ